MLRYVYICLIFTAFLTVSCQDSTGRSTIDLSSTRVDARFTCDTIKIKVNTEHRWQATCEAPWVEVLPRTDQNTLCFLLKDNLSTQTRQTNIYLSTDEADASILVVQNGTGNLPIDRVRDSLVLAAIYKECGGEQWSFMVEHKPVDGWDLQRPFPTWRGVSTASIGGVIRVTGIDLSGVGLEGVLPKQIYSLSELQVFLMPDNRITLSPFDVLARLPKLTYVDLSYNYFKLTFPDQMGSLSQIHYLYLNGVDCSGVSNDRLALMRELTILEMSGSYILGDFPLFVRSLTKLEHLSLSNNRIQGELPSWIGELTRLTNLDLSFCAMSGLVPQEIGLLTGLEELKLAVNGFSGAIPSSIGRLKSLRGLNLSECHFSSIPGSLISCGELEYLDLSFNDIQGRTFLEDLIKLPRLEFCSLIGNRFEGVISDDVLNSPRWKTWYGAQLICPQQVGYGFENCK